MPSKLGFGNTRKKSTRAEYGSMAHYKNPIMKKEEGKKKESAKTKTKFTDKIKAFGGAMVDAAAAGENLGRFGRHYRSRKRAYRRDDAVKNQ